MPNVTIDVIKDVFSPAQKKELIAGKAAWYLQHALTTLPRGAPR